MAGADSVIGSARNTIGITAETGRPIGRNAECRDRRGITAVAGKIIADYTRVGYVLLTDRTAGIHEQTPGRQDVIGIELQLIVQIDTGITAGIVNALQSVNQVHPITGRLAVDEKTGSDRGHPRALFFALGRKVNIVRKYFLKG